MDLHAKVYVAGHRGLAGSALIRKLQSAGHTGLIVRSHRELDLTDQRATGDFFQKERPEYVFLAAARVGGIQANNDFPAEFIGTNLAIQTNVIHAAWRSGVRRLLFLGSSCIYPKLAPQPLKEECLLNGPLEPTNRPYALAKIAGIEMCWSYNRQYGTRFLAAMPNNLYGPGDNYDLNTSHVLPALIRKFDEARVRGDRRVSVWGTGAPRREFLYSDDMADACVFLMNLRDERFDSLLGSRPYLPDKFQPPLINIGSGEECSILELAEHVRGVTGFTGDIVFDRTKPDGTPRKLLDHSKLEQLGWRRRTPLMEGLKMAYSDYRRSQIDGSRPCVGVPGS